MPQAAAVRVRFAPSPTGFLHIGAMRSALFNYLMARHHEGVFIVRIEDTDQARLVPGAMEQIQASLEWLGLECDEGPYIQSARLKIYHTEAERLIQTGALYPCWCSAERLTQLRQEAQAQHSAFKYDRYCLTHSGNLNDPHVLRFRIPDNITTISWIDAVRGSIEFKVADLDDFVALKSDGFPTYHFANVVDDHDLNISHVLRADEWLASTPKHLLLYQAGGWSPPVFAHLPAVQGLDKRAKLSKRLGAKPVLEYRDAGYLPEAVINFLALLGWNEGEGSTQEIYTRDELIAKFSLERVQSSPAAFDEERLIWFNGRWMRRLWEEDPGELLRRCRGFWSPAGERAAEPQRRAALALVQERLKFLAELPELTDFFFADPTIDPKLFQDSSDATKAYLDATIALIRTGIDLGSAETAEAAFRTQLLPQLNLAKPGPLFMTLRIALTGKTATPGLFETMAVLGRDTVLRRLEQAQTAIQV